MYQRGWSGAAPAQAGIRPADWRDPQSQVSVQSPLWPGLVHGTWYPQPPPGIISDWVLNAMLCLSCATFLSGSCYKFLRRQKTGADPHALGRRHGQRISPGQVALALLGSITVILLAVQYMRHGRILPLTLYGAIDKSYGSRAPHVLSSGPRTDAVDRVPWVRDPNAVDPQSVCPGYVARSVRNTAAGLTADLELAGPPCNVFGRDIQQLTLVVEYQAPDRLHIGIQPSQLGPDNETWFVLPEELVPKPGVDRPGEDDDDELEFSWSNKPTFSFNVTRRATGDVLFATQGSVLIYEDQFLEFGSPLPRNYNVYGLGEVIHGFRLGNDLTRTLYNSDQEDPVDGNLYGSHPVYLETRYFEQGEKTGELVYAADNFSADTTYQSFTHGLFLRNAHPQEVLLRPSNITWRALGGSIDLYFYAGPDAESAMSSYQKSATGLPAMQQYWTLGFHQCRWGYGSWAELQDVVDGFDRASIPLETVWTDIDYMDRRRDFVNDPVGFGYAAAAEFLERLHASGRHYVPIVDAAIYAPDPNDPGDVYAPFDRGVAADAFIENPDGSLYIGQVWPGYTVFPDWIGSSLNGSGAFEWWTSEISRWHGNVDFDGIWVDMNEVSSFCTGSCGSSSRQPRRRPPASMGAYEAEQEPIRLEDSALASPSQGGGVTRNVVFPGYVINNVNGELGGRTVSPDGTHHGGYLEYDFHNLFGHQMINTTYQALLTASPGRRPFIIGRSTFAGTGQWAGHWGGDNFPRWEYMAYSIPQALSFSLFGVPVFGVDTCGFEGDTTPELCSRWMQLSAFFTFYRNHNTIGAAPQEPYAWPEVAKASRTAMAIRYALLPYVYTLLAQAHAAGSTVMRALAWEFPAEPWLAGADRQFLLGPALLVTPVLEQGAVAVDGYFPGTATSAGAGRTVWYDWYNQSAVPAGDVAGSTVTIAAPLGHIPLFVRGGHIISLQEPRMTTAECRRTPWALLVALGADGMATGTLYLDDGESLQPNATTWVMFFGSTFAVTARPEGDFRDANPLANVTVLGLRGAAPPRLVTFNGRPLPRRTWTYSAASRSMSVTGLGALTPGGAWGTSWALAWE